MTPAIVVIDGEHYPPVVRDAIAGLPYEVIGAWLAGGTEKLRGEPDYGVPLIEALEDGFADAEVVVDLSDEPVLGPPERLLLASRVLAAGLRYEGADFRFEPPQYAPFPLPSLAVIGTIVSAVLPEVAPMNLNAISLTCQAMPVTGTAAPPRRRCGPRTIPPPRACTSSLEIRPS